MPKPWITKGTRLRIRYLEVGQPLPGEGLNFAATEVEFTGTVKHIYSDTPDGSGKVWFEIERDDTKALQEVKEEHVVGIV